MTDQELLEKAARAAGIEFTENDEEGNLYEIRHDLKRLVVWNPLDDDGDALILAVKLQISVYQNIVRVEAGTISLALAGVFIHEDTIYQDSLIATRRAITRAAAAMADL